MEYYLLGAFSLEERLYKMKGCWERKNLVECPEILKYTKKNDGNIIYYLNNMQCCVFIMKYGEFSSTTDMKEDYNSESEDSIYRKCYLEILKSINNKFHVSMDDVSWIMPLVTQDVIQIGESCIHIESEVDAEKLDYVTMIDCAMIYQSIYNMSVYFRSLSSKEDLDRFEQYQLSFYIQTINLIKNPVYFLTNSEEIKLYEEFYKNWKLTEQIDVVSELAEKTIELFSFLATYKKKNKVNVVEFFIPYISLVLSYNSIMETVVFLYHRWHVLWK